MSGKFISNCSLFLALVGRAFTARRPSAPHSTKRGVALLLVLGLIAILSILMLTFSRVTRTERLSSWHEVNSLRAEELTRLALTRAMADLQGRTQGGLYGWATTNIELGLTALGFCSRGSSACSNILDFTTSEELPESLLTSFYTAEDNVQWITITIESNLWPNTSGLVSPSSTVGRISYIVLNASDCADLNMIGDCVFHRSTSTSPYELDPCGLYSNEITDASIFLATRMRDGRYETQSEAANLNPAITNCQALVPYSYDPDRDVYFTTTNTAQLGTRAFTNNLMRRFCVNADVGSTNWLANIESHLNDCSITNVNEVALRLADYLDADRIPSNPLFTSEAIPLLNEAQLQAEGVSTTQYVLQVEFWYPFDTPPTNGWFDISIQATNTPSTSFTATIPCTDCTPDRFSCFTWTNAALTNFDTNVRFTVDVSWQGTPVFQRTLDFTATGTFAWVDPRCDIRSSTNAPSFGTTNANCTALAAGSHGLPIHHRDGAMLNIGELGYIHTGGPWRNIDLADMKQAALLDRLTVRTTYQQGSTLGLLSAGTAASQTLDRLFYRTRVGSTNVVSPDDVASVVTAFTAYDNPSIPDSGRGMTLGTLSSDFLRSLTNGSLLGMDLSTNFLGTDLKEDLVRGFVELVSFRHSLYYVIVSAQALAADGQTRVAERNAIALVWRDTYTGQYFVRWFRWLE